MKSNFIKIGCISLLVCFMSCKKETNEIKNGIIEEHNEKGKLISQTLWRNDKKNGFCISYYPTGHIKGVFNYANDSLDGMYCLYFPNQKLKQFGKYRNGKFNGSNITLHENGTFDYVDQMYNGEQYCHGEFDSFGKVISKKFFIIENSSAFVKLGDEFVCRIKIFNPSVFNNLQFWIADLFPTGAPKSKKAQLKIINNEVVFNEKTNSIGQHVFSGVVLGECRQKFNIKGVAKDTTLNAIFPIYELYEVKH